MQEAIFPAGDVTEGARQYPYEVRDIHEIRLQNLRFLREECAADLGKERGATARLASISGVKASLLSMLLKGALHSETGGRRQIGDDTARKMESGMGKDPNWLDVDRSQARDFKEAATLDKLRKLSASQREAVERLMDEFAGAPGPTRHDPHQDDPLSSGG
ncbi:MAG: hypothetical protein ACRC1H_09105 [Caldilineaceae bacterium]